MTEPKIKEHRSSRKQLFWCMAMCTLFSGLVGAIPFVVGSEPKWVFYGVAWGLLAFANVFLCALYSDDFHQKLDSLSMIRKQENPEDK